MATQGRPWITWDSEMSDQDVTVRCKNGHTVFGLIIRVRLAGALITRHARCSVCDEEQPID